MVKVVAEKCVLTNRKHIFVVNKNVKKQKTTKNNLRNRKFLFNCRWIILITITDIQQVTTYESLKMT